MRKFCDVMFFARRASVLLLFACCAHSGDASEHPNIVYILADDFGYGDASCYNPESKIATPNIDALAAGGMRFTDAHTPSAVCTPTRYGILTGRYCWRTRLKYRVLDGFDPPLIESTQMTVPGLLKRNGYHTICVGKWHLGMQWTDVDGNPIPAVPVDRSGPPRDGRNVDYSVPFTGGPTSVARRWCASSADTASSQSTSSGRVEIARAMAARWSCPPLSS